MTTTPKWNWGVPCITMRDMQIGQIAEIIDEGTPSLVGMKVWRIANGAVSLSDPHLAWTTSPAGCLPDFAVRILPSGSEIAIVTP